MSKKYEATLYIAKNDINQFMKKLDLRPDFKIFCTPQTVSFATTTEVNDDYFERIIKLSKKNKDFWIPAISCLGIFYYDKNIKVISDGKNEFYITKNTEENEYA